MEHIVEDQSNDMVVFLKDELDRRKKNNSRYSLRSFANSLKISPAQLSQLMNGKRNFTPTILNQISKALHFSPEEERKMHTDVFLSKYFVSESAAKKHQLKEDEFRLIADWYHFAILSLCKIKNAKADPYWISSRLGITVAEAKESLHRLKRLNIIEDSKLLKRKAAPLNVVSEVPSRAILAYHNKILNLALDKLNSVPTERRDFSAMTFLADPKKIPAARKMVEEFQDQLANFFQTPNAKEVFLVSCQVFPLEGTEK
ncbi:MAG: TIGR02147 family protein [Bdellovibrio sp.]